MSGCIPRGYDKDIGLRPIYGDDSPNASYKTYKVILPQQANPIKIRLDELLGMMPDDSWSSGVTLKMLGIVDPGEESSLEEAIMDGLCYETPSTNKDEKHDYGPPYKSFTEEMLKFFKLLKNPPPIYFYSSANRRGNVYENRCGNAYFKAHITILNDLRDWRDKLVEAREAEETSVWFEISNILMYSKFLVDLGKYLKKEEWSKFQKTDIYEKWRNQVDKAKEIQDLCEDILRS